jgi:hypothetical protein
MAFLDFVRNSGTGQEQSAAGNTQTQKPATAKEMYKQQAEQEKPGRKALNQMPPDQQAKVEAISAKLQKATQHIQQKNTVQPGAPSDSGASPEPMRQNMAGQDKAAPALSPTSMQAGITAAEKGATAPSQESSAKSPEKQALRARQTVPRRPPSWER